MCLDQAILTMVIKRIGHKHKVKKLSLTNNHIFFQSLWECNWCLYSCNFSNVSLEVRSGVKLHHQ